MRYPPSFGPMYWRVMMIVATEFPDNPTEEQKKTVLDWLTLTMILLPCPSCSMHAREYIKKHVPDVSSREALIAYIVEFHNYVNVSLGKTTYTVLEAKAAFFTQMTKDVDGLPRSMEVVKENTDRIKKMQSEIINYRKQLASYETNTPQSVFYYATIALGIILAIYMIATIVVLIRQAAKIRSLNKEVKKNKPAVSTPVLQ